MSGIGRLLYLYVGTGHVGDALAYYCDVLGAEKVWDAEAFGTRVAAVRLGEGPLYLLAGHRHAPSVLPIYESADLEATMAAFRARGWRAEGEVFEVPDGPCVLCKDPGGNELAFLQVTRPGAMEGEEE